MSVIITCSGITNINCHQISGLKGRNVTISGGQVLVDGMELSEFEKMQKQKIDLHLHIDGNVEQISGCESVEVKGRVGSIKTTSGDVVCGDVEGFVNTMSGDVRCKSVSGNVNTMSGNIIKGAGC